MARQRTGFWQRMWYDAWTDLRSIRWKRTILSSAICVSTIGLLVLAIVLLCLKHFVPPFSSACTPDGAFRLYPRSYSYWSRSGVFQITLRYGELSFGLAKFIDVAWDIVFGRGGQAVLAVASWSVFRNYVTTSMEVAPVTYNSFRVVFLETGPTLFSIGRLMRDFSVRKGFQSKIATAFILATMIFTLAFPTLASAMTGYTAALKAYVPDHQNANYIRFDKFEPAVYMIHDGDRINKTKDFVVTDIGVGDPILDIQENSTLYTSYCGIYRRVQEGGRYYNEIFDHDFDYYGDERISDCLVVNNVSNYYRDWYFRSGSSSSTFMGQILDPPILNITPYYIYDPSIYGWDFITQGVSKMAWSWSNETYDYAYVTAKGTCQSTGHYQWGFSFIQLFVMNIMLLVWAIGILTMWAVTRMTMRKRGRRAIAGEHKATLELAASMNKELFIENADLQSLSEQDIKERITNVAGGNIAYSLFILNERTPLNVEIRAWFKRERWWLCAISLFLIPASFVWIWPPLVAEVALLGPLFGLVFSVAFGTTYRSRILFTFVSSILLWLITILPPGIVAAVRYG
ncbi:hypothetical protein K458DRAFT_379709 [Lentithecium fluviatile CBS 122367]|uniref:Uncharacterized protein n=1 Tax=Lentithecium fluviatile CBS 122367 TaxID=1168545 RepID=A0A6G1IF90_9PLEO|nr:hypothetical protein K458DRAFT_379709 [Lentithecium fluviatile CBS 122367]